MRGPQAHSPPPRTDARCTPADGPSAPKPSAPTYFGAPGALLLLFFSFSYDILSRPGTTKTRVGRSVLAIGCGNRTFARPPPVRPTNPVDVKPLGVHYADKTLGGQPGQHFCKKRRFLEKDFLHACCLFRRLWCRDNRPKPPYGAKPVKIREIFIGGGCGKSQFTGMIDLIKQIIANVVLRDPLTTGKETTKKYVIRRVLTLLGSKSFVCSLTREFDRGKPPKPQSTPVLPRRPVADPELWGALFFRQAIYVFLVEKL